MPSADQVPEGHLMALRTANICTFDWKARDFALKGINGVKASIGRIVAEANALRQIGIGTIAIMPNDTGGLSRGLV